jgi:hypothetical protein
LYLPRLVLSTYYIQEEGGGIQGRRKRRRSRSYIPLPKKWEIFDFVAVRIAACSRTTQRK